MIYGIWVGGANYSDPDPDLDVERFDDVDDAMGALVDRYERGDTYRQYFEYANREARNVLCPGVSSTARMLVFTALDTDDDGTVLVHTNGPDLTIRLDADGAPYVD